MKWMPPGLVHTKNSSFTVHPYNGSQWGPSTVLVAVILQLSYDKMYFFTPLRICECHSIKYNMISKQVAFILKKDIQAD